MFYKLIEKKRDEWLDSPECTIGELVEYIEHRGQMRDAQIEAIKTYLFLKIACGNKPLYELFYEGRFNSISANDLPLTSSSRAFIENNPAAVALLEYAQITDSNGRQLAPELEKFIVANPDKVDYKKVFFELFYKVSYTDYLFSLPMGAGKTYLMAAFMYIDLYFAQNEPFNSAFAHNFIVFAPSGLKSSVVPSLKTIQKFDASWIIPEPAASDLKRLIKFEVLDAVKTQNKSNKTKNPNVQKINLHLQDQNLMGLVAVTNAEKVILDRVNVESEIFMGVEVEHTEDERDRLANELRNLIGKIPNLAIYIDEVHHAVDEDIKLRNVINKWMCNHTVNSVVGFSGTPYLDKAESVHIAEKFTIKNTELTNVVYYYPLIEGIDNFLKDPEVKISDHADSMEIVEKGVRDFLKKYNDTVYADGTTAKLGIYCGKIENLEEAIYPTVATVVQEYGLNPNDVILKYHRGNKDYPAPKGAEAEFASLDTPVSRKKIILLVQIGKEGWDCKSLTGIILSQKGDCPTNMVLQTSCRCLRQVDKGEKETALIWLNEFNANILNKQLKSQQNITLEEFSNKRPYSTANLINRYRRTDYLALPPIDFYQLEVQYEPTVVDEQTDVSARLKSIDMSDYVAVNRIIIQKLDGSQIEKSVDKAVNSDIVNFNLWLSLIAKESFGLITISQLKEYADQLHDIFSSVIDNQHGTTYLNNRYDQEKIRHRVRRAFYVRRSFVTTETMVQKRAELLKPGSLQSPIIDADLDKFYPSENKVRQIIEADRGGMQIDEKSLWDNIEMLEKAGMYDAAELARRQLQEASSSDFLAERNFTYHYLPYRFDSGFERTFFCNVLSYKGFRNHKDLEIYYNGDDALTEFKIKCYRNQNQSWITVGNYTPDFLILRRDADRIEKIMIVETKGEIYSTDPTFKYKKQFMEEFFIGSNNERYGYKRFDYVYLEDTLEESMIQYRLEEAINKFFE